MLKAQATIQAQNTTLQTQTTVMSGKITDSIILNDSIDDEEKKGSSTNDQKSFQMSLKRQLESQSGSTSIAQVIISNKYYYLSNVFQPKANFFTLNYGQFTTTHEAIV